MITDEHRAFVVSTTLSGEKLNFNQSTARELITCGELSCVISRQDKKLSKLRHTNESIRFSYPFVYEVIPLKSNVGMFTIRKTRWCTEYFHPDRIAKAYRLLFVHRGIHVYKCP